MQAKTAAQTYVVEVSKISHSRITRYQFHNFITNQARLQEARMTEKTPTAFSIRRVATLTTNPTNGALQSLSHLERHQMVALSGTFINWFQLKTTGNQMWYEYQIFSVTPSDDSPMVIGNITSNVTPWKSGDLDTLSDLLFEVATGENRVFLSIQLETSEKGFRYSTRTGNIVHHGAVVEIRSEGANAKSVELQAGENPAEFRNHAVGWNDNSSILTSFGLRNRANHLEYYCSGGTLQSKAVTRSNKRKALSVIEDGLEMVSRDFEDLGGLMSYSIAIDSVQKKGTLAILSSNNVKDLSNLGIIMADSGKAFTTMGLYKDSTGKYCWIAKQGSISTSTLSVKYTSNDSKTYTTETVNITTTTAFKTLKPLKISATSTTTNRVLVGFGIVNDGTNIKFQYHFSPIYSATSAANTTFTYTSVNLSAVATTTAVLDSSGNPTDLARLTLPSCTQFLTSLYFVDDPSKTGTIAWQYRFTPPTLTI